MSKNKDSDFEPAVTPTSSKADLWDELECVRTELGFVHDRMLDYQRQLVSMELKMSVARMQLRIIKAALDDIE